MKNLLILVVLLFGIAVQADAQACCKAADASKCKVTACTPAKGTAVSASLMPPSATNAPACTPEQIAACKAVCTPEQIAACQAVCTPEQIAECLNGKKMSNKEMKSCQQACASKGKAACAPAAPAQSTEKSVDRTYHAVATPSKS